MSHGRRKTCRGCDRTLPEDRFYWHKYRNRPWRRRAQCIECMLVQQARIDAARDEGRRVYDRQRGFWRPDRPTRRRPA